MIIDRERVKNTFAEYTSGYNATDPKIKLKIDHTYRVAELCELIASDLKLDEYETDVAWLTGMLHDVGRFEQIKRYNTYLDKMMAFESDNEVTGKQFEEIRAKLNEYVESVKQL